MIKTPSVWVTKESGVGISSGLVQDCSIIWNGAGTVLELELASVSSVRATLLGGSVDVLIKNSFKIERRDLCWKNKDLWRRSRRSASMNLEALCRVLPLLVETCGRLLLPPCKSFSSSKPLSREGKGAPSSSKKLDLGWLPCSPKNLLI